MIIAAEASTPWMVTPKSATPVTADSVKPEGISTIRSTARSSIMRSASARVGTGVVLNQGLA